MKNLESNIFFPLMYTLSADRRAEMSAEINCWEWPDEFLCHKPEGWDKMTGKEKFGLKPFQDLYEALELTVSDWEKSRAWWKNQGIKTDEHHCKWWASGCKSDALSRSSWEAADKQRQPTRELHESEDQEGNSQPEKLQQQIQP